MGTGSARSRSAPSTWRYGTLSLRSPASRCFDCSPNDTAVRPIRGVRLRRRRLLLPRKRRSRTSRRDALLLDRGYTVVKMKIGNSIAEDQPRIEGVLKELDGKAQLAVDANGRLTLEQGIAYAKMLRDYPLFWYEEVGDPLDFALQAALCRVLSGPDGDRREPVQPPGRPQSAALRRDAVRTATGCSSTARFLWLCEYQRTLECLKAAGWSPSRCIPHGGHQMSLNIAAGLGLGGNESYPDLFQPYGGSRWRAGRGQPHRHAGTSRHRLRGQKRPDQGHARSGGVTSHGHLRKRECIPRGCEPSRTG